MGPLVMVSAPLGDDLGPLVLVNAPFGSDLGPLSAFSPLYRLLLDSLRWGTVDAKMKFPSAENSKLSRRFQL